MAMLSSGEPDVIDVDDFIKAFTNGVNDSPARPPLGDMGVQFANHQANYKQQQYGDNSSPFEQTFGLTDIHGHNSTEWFTNMDHIGIESVLGVSTPSSRGSSLETPNIPQPGFVGSIDPSRLKEASRSYDGTNDMTSPAWHVNQQLPPQQCNGQLAAADNHNNNSLSGDPHHHQHHQHQQHAVPMMQVHKQQPSASFTLERKPSGPEQPAPLGKRKRQGSLPDIFIPIPQSQPRVLQRSVSTGATMAFNGVAAAADPTSPFLSNTTSPGPMSAPPLAQHPQSFAPSAYQAPVNNVAAPANGAATPGTGSGVTPAALSKAQHGHGHARAFSYSALATIPEAPSSAPAEWTPMGQQQALGLRYTNASDMSTYQVPQPPATPSLPSTSPMIHSAPMPPAVQRQSAPRSLPLARPNSCPGTQPATAIPTHMSQQQPLQQQQQQVLSYSPTIPHQQLAPQQYPQHQQQGMSPQMTHNQFSPQLQHMSGAVGIGRPLLPPSSAHIRRSSDSELAFASGYPNNVGAMLRSTSVPQAPGQALGRPGPVYGTAAIPPPPPVATYTSFQYVPFEPGHLGYGQPGGGSKSPPRKRVTSKRVGTCLKPGPKGKVKPKVDSDAHPAPPPMPINFDDEPLVEIGQGLLPVSIEEFQAAFTITPQRSLIPNPALELLTDRLMYATPEPVVDACFRWCYQIGSEFNKAAEKQSKFFRCCFDECAGSSGRIFMRKSAVDSHVRTHVGYRPFKCEADPECDARFVRKHDRDRHVATTHRNEKSFLCGDCGQNFARSDALLRHRAKRDACKARIG